MRYQFSEDRPRPAEYVALREAAGLKPRTEAAARRGLPNTLHAITVRTERELQAAEASEGRTDPDADAVGNLVGMGRVVGDDGCYYQLVDVAVRPDQQRRGLGSRIVERLLEYVAATAPPSAYVSLISDVDGFYERFGFADARPESKGMFLCVDDL